MHFTKKHNKKGLKKMQANNAKAMSAHAEASKALINSKKVKPKIPKTLKVPGLGETRDASRASSHSRFGWFCSAVAPGTKLT
ncbi:hypothetical protein P7K49_026255, partial [Saguinus oedipus]